MRVLFAHVLSLGAKISANTLATALPLVVLSPRDYGEYAVAISAVWLTSAFLEAGTGMELSVSGGDAAQIRPAVRYINVRDTLLFCLLAASVALAFAPILVGAAGLAALLTARWTSISGAMRGSGTAWLDAVSSCCILFCTAAFGVWVLTWQASAGPHVALTSVDLLLLLVCMPRALVLIALLLKRSAGSNAGRLTQRYYPKVAYAGPMLLAVAATNADIVLLSLFASPDLVGTMRIVTLVFGMLVLGPELVSQSAQSQLAALKLPAQELVADLARRMRAFGWGYHAFASSAMVLTLLTIGMDASGAEKLLLALLLVSALAFRVTSYPYASSLTLSNRQATRFAVSALCMGLYFGLVFMLSALNFDLGLPIALCAASLFQLGAYKRAAKPFSR